MKELITHLILRCETLVNEQQEIVKQLYILEDKYNNKPVDIIDMLNHDHEQFKNDLTDALNEKKKEKVTNIKIWQEKIKNMSHTQKKIYE